VSHRIKRVEHSLTVLLTKKQRACIAHVISDSKTALMPAAAISSILYAEARGFVGEHNALRSEIALISNYFGGVDLGGLPFPPGRPAGR
jgi:hypothetical protein